MQFEAPLPKPMNGREARRWKKRQNRGSLEHRKRVTAAKKQAYLSAQARQRRHRKKQALAHRLAVQRGSKLALAKHGGKDNHSLCVK